MQSNSVFVTLVKRRRKVVTWLTAATLVPYYVFIFVAAYKPDMLAVKLDATSVVTLGWVAGFLLIVGTWLLTGLYVRYANGEFDELTRKLEAGVAP